MMLWGWLSFSEEEAWSEKRTQDGWERNAGGKGKAEEEIPVQEAKKDGPEILKETLKHCHGSQRQRMF